MTPITIIGLFSLLITFAALIGPTLRFWLERPKLKIFLRDIIFTDKNSNKKTKMTQLLMFNYGYRPLIITRIEYLSKDGGRGCCGIYDELKAPYGIADVVLPKLLKSAERFEFNFLASIVMNKIKEITIFNSNNKKYKIGEKDLVFFVKKRRN